MKWLRWTLLLTALLTGCSRFELRSDGLPEDAVYFTPLPGSAQHFTETDNAAFLFWGLVTVKAPLPADKLLPYLDSNSRIANLTITTQTSFVDYLISAVTMGIYSTRTVKYEGDVVAVSGKKSR